jgi:hypothetical protein
MHMLAMKDPVESEATRERKAERGEGRGEGRGERRGERKAERGEEEESQYEDTVMGNCPRGTVHEELSVCGV